MPRKLTHAELTEANASLSHERSTLAMAFAFTVQGAPDATERFTVGECGERESYTLHLYGATRANGGTVVQIRTYHGVSLPDVSAFDLERGRPIAHENAAHNLNDLTSARRDAIDRLYVARNALVQAFYDAKKAS